VCMYDMRSVCESLSLVCRGLCGLYVHACVHVCVCVCMCVCAYMCVCVCMWVIHITAHELLLLIKYLVFTMVTVNKIRRCLCTRQWGVTGRAGACMPEPLSWRKSWAHLDCSQE